MIHLGKELIAGMGYLTGYDGSERFHFPGIYRYFSLLLD